MEWGCGFGRGAAAALRRAAGWVSFEGFDRWGLGPATVVGFRWLGSLSKVFLFIDCAKKIGVLSNHDVEMLRNKKFVVFPGDWAPWGRRGLTAVVGFGFRSLLGLFWMVPESKFVC